MIEANTMAPLKPDLKSLLQVLTKARLVDLRREFDVSIRASSTKAKQIEALARTGLVQFDAVLPWLGRDELKTASRAHGLEATGRARAELAARLSGAHLTVGAPGKRADPRTGSRNRHARRHRSLPRRGGDSEDSSTPIRTQ